MRDFGNGAAERDRCVEDARAIKMHGDSCGVRAIADFVGDVLWIDRAAGHVVAIF